ncbi:amidohydrolase [Hujiaoplasma nucleasis]|uniref:Amidohydrolase n=1 Tax=Hujiaoplasma nucleasis TaxID=2725268 RepID=A0A7L6N4H6_9MOLU|nr:amidohydrolase [Hujiaoplasma nucleasis]QLY39479.1 amidohydrolase [Hujiaoplasma nucleasis]
MRLPGFIDSHLHVLGIGYFESIVDLSQCQSIEDLINLLKKYTNRPMIIGRGWNQDQFSEKRMVSKNDLNEVSKDIPIMVTRVCGHVIAVNDKMLELANIHDKSKQILGGHFDYESGIFSEKALSLIHRVIPKPNKELLKEYFLLADKILIKNGITAVASDDFCVFENSYEEIIEVLKELYDQGLMKVKITEQVNLPLDKLKDFIAKGYVRKQIHPKFKMGPLKILADGSLGGRTAALLEDYSDSPNEKGILTYTDEELFDLIHLADIHGMDTTIHAIGDLTTKQAIQTIAKSMKISHRYEHAHAIIHAQLTRSHQIPLMEKYNIGAIVQPIFINTDIKIIEDRLGYRTNDVYLFKSMYNKIRLGFSTDAPIEPVNPFYNIYTAMTYKSIKYPNEKSLNENQCFTLKEALDSYTVNNLDFIYQDQLDSNDYILIDKDIYHISTEEIKDIKVLKTFIDGEEVFSTN